MTKTQQPIGNDSIDKDAKRIWDEFVKSIDMDTVEFKSISDELHSRSHKKTRMDTDTSTFVEELIDNNIDVYKRLRDR